jgi:hypothetical protein
VFAPLARSWREPTLGLFQVSTPGSILASVEVQWERLTVVPRYWDALERESLWNIALGGDLVRSGR